MISICFLKLAVVDFLQSLSLSNVTFDLWSSSEFTGIKHLNSPHWILHIH
ncbi:hypothetical protein KC19_3G213700 [Ceratodon purpureus]|uniref:Uncharacterized protein n=1 Tax=Ceratodon purpureus TaxID=3225 RepID=A0A8T0INA9_CERPU|nr:hypothetical protein KC19_3G213700 [Ceratodon purpureus]